MKNPFLLAVILVAIMGCNQPTDSTPAIFEKEDIPINVGSWWKYYKVDSLHHIQDTILLTVTDVQTLSDSKEYKCLLTEQNTIIDTVSISINDLNIRWHSMQSQFSPFAYFEIKTPVIDGDSWPIDDGRNVVNPKFWVGSPYEHPLHGTTYTVYKAYQGIRYYTMQRIEVARKIGIVSIFTNSVGKDPIEKSLMTLIDYHIQ
ncbi:MAG: hypothetical protein K1X91_14925 [Bacteriodetes bacterium]|nr:hypothetical protein [Bacteroidota bacterium]